MDATPFQYYRNGREHLNDELARLDALLSLQVLEFRKRCAALKAYEVSGFYISDETVERILRPEPPSSAEHESSWFGYQEADALSTQIQTLRTLIAQKVETSFRHGIRLPLYQLSSRFHLTELERDMLLICLAPELDLKYETLYAYLQNDITRKRPCVNLILDLLGLHGDNQSQARISLAAQTPLMKYKLLRFCETDENASFLTRTLKIDGRIMNFLLNMPLPDDCIGTVGTLTMPEQEWAAVVLEKETRGAIEQVLKTYLHGSKSQRLTCYFQGPGGAGKKMTAEAVCRELQVPLIMVDTRKIARAPSAGEDLIARLFRETLLQPAAIYFDHFDRLMRPHVMRSHETDDEQNLMLRQRIFTWNAECSLLTFFAGETPWNVEAGESLQNVITIHFPTPSYTQRAQLWERALNDRHTLADDVDIDLLAGAFRLTGGQIRNAAADAANRAFFQSGNGDRIISARDLLVSCRAQSNQKLARLARKIVPHYTWADIVLPDDKRAHLQEVCNYAKHQHRVYDQWGFGRKLSLGKGLNVLFSGPSGTGKTMAAEIIANDLALDLYKIDLSCVVSKYIGETEKNLAHIFREAETSNAILFFDEADALFGKRSEIRDSHDRYANIEINYLLQKMEEHAGIAILATNFRENIDDAFTRRMHFAIEFLFPDQEYRLKIWQQIFPEETPVSEDLDFERLAKNLKVSGGNIKNIAVNAAFLAAESSKMVEMPHILQATKREYEKIGRLYDFSDFGHDAPVVKYL